MSAWGGWGEPQGGGGHFHFFSYVGSGLVSTIHPQKISGIQTPPKIFEILPTPKNTPILYLDLKKRPQNA